MIRHNNRFFHTVIATADQSGWIHNHPYVYLLHPTDQVIMGANAPIGTEKARFVGYIRIDDPTNNLAGIEATDGGSWPVSPANTGRIRYNEGTQRWEQSSNGAAYLPLGGISPGTIISVPLPGSESGQQVVQGVAATPGWVVIDAFKYVAAQHTVPAPGSLTRIFSAVVIASTAALQVRLKLVRSDTLADVAGSTLTFAAPVNAAEQWAETADLTAALVDGIIYQIVAECTGGATPTDYATVRSSGVRAVISY